jgi:coenzyme PQQ precursor peptide PqqA
MMLRLSAAGPFQQDARGDGARPSPQPGSRSHVMKWETPSAIDFRFGMEITMYIANR